MGIEKIRQVIQEVKVDALYGKKKHFNAAVRKSKYNNNYGLIIIGINTFTGSVLFYLISNNDDNTIKYISAILAFLAAFLSALQTYFNFAKQVEGHNNIANKFRALAKKCRICEAHVEDSLINQENVVNKCTELSSELEAINTEALPFETSKKDYQLARKGFKDGEEIYLKEELEGDSND